jgi:hypothetical protein
MLVGVVEQVQVLGEVGGGWDDAEPSASRPQPRVPRGAPPPHRALGTPLGILGLQPAESSFMR